MKKIEKRHSQDTARNWPGRVIGSIVVDCCNHCPRFMITLCQETGRKIMFPISGPINKECPLPVSRREGDADGKSPLNGPATRSSEA